MPTDRTVEQICRDLLEIADRQDEVIVSVVDPQKMSASDLTAMANELTKILQRDAKDAERWRKYRNLAPEKIVHDNGTAVTSDMRAAQTLRAVMTVRFSGVTRDDLVAAIDGLESEER